MVYADVDGENPFVVEKLGAIDEDLVALPDVNAIFLAERQIVYWKFTC